MQISEEYTLLDWKIRSRVKLFGPPSGLLRDLLAVGLVLGSEWLLIFVALPSRSSIARSIIKGCKLPLTNNALLVPLKIPVTLGW
jgi:hypothetical protein